MEEKQKKLTTLILERLEKKELTRIHFSRDLGITRPTLNVRLKLSNWKPNEIKKAYELLN